MIEKIKKRIIHFYTHGNIIEDFVEARRKKSAKLRHIIHACFYIQCALAACCIAAALLMMTGTAEITAVIAGSAAVCVVAFISLGGGTAEKTILYILDLVYAVICFTAGGMMGSDAFILCGILMLLSAAAALVGFFAAWCRQYLLDFSPAKITSSDYTRLTPSISEPHAEAPRITRPTLPVPVPPPRPPKTEMEMLAEQLSDILESIANPRRAAPAEKSKESAVSDKDTNHTETDVLPALSEPAKPEEKIQPSAGKAYAAQAQPISEPKPSPSATRPKVINTADILPADLSIDI